MTYLAAILLSIVPIELTVHDRFDVIEVNVYYDGEGRVVFQQDIFRDRKPCGTARCEAWRLIKDDSQLPYYDHARGCWTCLWNDGGVLRRVDATGVRYTFTQEYFEGDPELSERAEYPKEKRAELRRIK